MERVSIIKAGPPNGVTSHREDLDFKDMKRKGKVSIRSVKIGYSEEKRLTGIDFLSCKDVSMGKGVCHQA